MALVIRPRTVGLAAVALACIALPASAGAQPWEQVNRGSGPYTTAPVASGYSPASAVGDVGRYAGFRATFEGGATGGFIRDVRTNLTTQPGGTATMEVLGFDRAETKALIVRQFATRIELAITPLQGGGASRVIYSTPVIGTGPADYYRVRAKLSGDGSTVVAVDRYAKTVVKINVATTAKTVLQSIGDTAADVWELPAQAISDDGRLVSLARPYFNEAGALNGRIYRDGAILVQVESSAALSPDGSTLVWRKPSTGAYTWNLRKLATGITSTLTAPSYSDLWVSSNGSKLILSRGVYPGYTPQQYDVATATWTALSGVYEKSVGLLSPNGRFSLGTLLVDRTGADIPGAEDPLSGDHYVKPGATYNCGSPFGPLFGKNYGEVQGTLLTKPVEFAPAAVRAEFKLYVDGTLLKTVSVLPGQSVQAPFKGSPQRYRVLSQVTDDQGRVTSGTSVGYFAGCA